MIEAGCTVIGGHSIRDEETKFGYSVTGVIHPKKIYQNAGAKPGDKLILTKAIGTGVISTAIKKGKAEESWIDAAIASMTTLNKKAAEAITNAGATTGHVGTDAFVRPVEQSSTASSPQPSRTQPFEIHAMTDITGFGLIGHAREMALASGVTIEIAVDQVRLLPGALDYARAGAVPGGLNNNRDFASCAVETRRELPRELEDLMYDPQTSGGLFYTLPEAEAAKITRAWRVGRVVERGERPIRLIWR
jgi:selenide,water dikinase